MKYDFDNADLAIGGFVILAAIALIVLGKEGLALVGSCLVGVGSLAQPGGKTNGNQKGSTDAGPGSQG